MSEGWGQTDRVRDIETKRDTDRHTETDKDRDRHTHTGTQTQRDKTRQDKFFISEGSE